MQEERWHNYEKKTQVETNCWFLKEVYVALLQWPPVENCSYSGTAPKCVTLWVYSSMATKLRVCSTQLFPGYIKVKVKPWACSAFPSAITPPPPHAHTHTSETHIPLDGVRESQPHVVSVSHTFPLHWPQTNHFYFTMVKYMCISPVQRMPLRVGL